jgi:hypothetical protein
MAQFEQALRKLMDDRHYRELVIKEPTRLTKDYSELGVQEILLLMQVWQASGHPEAFSIISLCHCCCSHN